MANDRRLVPDLENRDELQAPDTRLPDRQMGHRNEGQRFLGSYGRVGVIQAGKAFGDQTSDRILVSKRASRGHQTTVLAVIPLRGSGSELRRVPQLIASREQAHGAYEPGTATSSHGSALAPRLVPWQRRERAAALRLLLPGLAMDT